MWGQYYTEAAWEGVLGALRAGPPEIIGGAAGEAAGVCRLLEAFVNLVAVQLMIDNGPEVSKLAVGVQELLEALGETGDALLSSAPPTGGGPWDTIKIMLMSVPRVAM